MYTRMGLREIHHGVDMTVRDKSERDSPKIARCVIETLESDKTNSSMPPLSASTVAEEKTTPPRDEVASRIEETPDLQKEDDDLLPVPLTEAEQEEDEKSRVPMQIVWRNVILFAYLHMAALYGAYRIFTSAMWQTTAFAVFLYIISGLGVTAGAHRLWAHRSYKARFPLRVFLAFIFSIAFENDIFDWARDHRVHHKFSETNADPHNAKRGFFFSHIGWLLVKKHPDVVNKGKGIDFSDLLADPVVRFHRRHYLKLVILCCFVLPTLVPMYLWGESFLDALLVSTLLRFCFTLNQTWLVNSAAHMWGSKPYDVHINPSDNLWVSLGAVGEGFHNYHHTFPWDYATSEYGIKYNLTTAFIDTMAWLGLAYDRKTVAPSTVQARKERTGPSSVVHPKEE